MKNSYIPVMAINENNKKEKWYLDVNNLSLSELITLRKKLDGISVECLDAIIYDKTCTETFSRKLKKERAEDGKSLIRKKSKRRNENRSKMKRR